jgi:shikimate kinase
MSKIVLVGFPGSGKTTAGRKIANSLGYKFMDLDKEFELRYHISVSEFLQKYSEESFRKCENNLLKLALGFDNIVVSTGGGTPCFFNAMEEINRNAISVYIKMTCQSLHNRLINSKKERPLTDKKNSAELMEYIERTMEVRKNIYSKAHITVKGESLNISDLVNIISNYSN